MQATCAICAQPITQRGKFVIVGTEVMHRACAARGGVTVGWKMRQDLERARADLATEQRNVMNLREQVKQQTEIARDRFRIMEHRKRTIDDMTRNMGQLTARVDALTRVADRLTAEAVPSVVVDAQAQRVAVQGTSEPSRDATEVRFSLLEFDTL